MPLKITGTSGFDLSRNVSRKDNPSGLGGYNLHTVPSISVPKSHLNLIHSNETIPYQDIPAHARDVLPQDRMSLSTGPGLGGDSFYNVDSSIEYLPSNGSIHVINGTPTIIRERSKINKSTDNNNPGNITGMSGKLLYNAAAIVKSNTGDKGDRAQLYFATPDDGWKAMDSLMSSKRYNSTPISSAFRQYQTDTKMYDSILSEYRRKGIDVDKLRYNDLSQSQKKIFMETRARWEGYKGRPMNVKYVFGN
jgi:hypothetical protein